MKVNFENLTKRFGDVTAVNNLSLEFESGKLICLLGPSGCGKTTILNMLSGIMPVTEGKIYFDDVDVTGLTPDKREVGDAAETEDVETLHILQEVDGALSECDVRQILRGRLRSGVADVRQIAGINEVVVRTRDVEHTVREH